MSRAHLCGGGQRPPPLCVGVQGLGRQQAAQNIESGKGKLWGWTSAAQKYDEIQLINKLKRLIERNRKES